MTTSTRTAVSIRIASLSFYSVRQAGTAECHLVSSPTMDAYVSAMRTALYAATKVANVPADVVDGRGRIVASFRGVFDGQGLLRIESCRSRVGLYADIEASLAESVGVRVSA